VSTALTSAASQDPNAAGFSCEDGLCPAILILRMFQHQLTFTN